MDTNTDETVESSFFGLVIKPKYQYKTVLRDELLLTRAIIDPSSTPDQKATLFATIDNRLVPLASLDGATITSLPLNTQLYPSTEIKFKVTGDVPVHVTGYYSPSVRSDPPDFISHQD